MKKKIDFKVLNENIAKKYLASNSIPSTEIVQNHQQIPNNVFAQYQLSPSQAVLSTTQSSLNTNLQNTNENNSVHLLEEINSLKNFLQQKDLLIEELYGEKQELATKLAVSESNNLSLSKESMELRADKIELRNDKSRLNEEILALRQSDSAKAAEIEQLKKEFAELNLISALQIDASQLEANSLIGELQQNNQLGEAAIHNPLIARDTVHSILLSVEESVLLGDSILQSTD